MLSAWSKAVGRNDKEMTKNHRICELHFRNEEILREYETLLPDGSVHKMKKGRPSLAANVVPSIFPLKSLPPNPVSDKSVLSNEKSETTQENEKIWDNIKAKCNGENSFKILTEYCTVIPMPKYWTVNQGNDFLAWINIDEKTLISKRVILFSNMTMKVSTVANTFTYKDCYI